MSRGAKPQGKSPRYKINREEYGRKVKLEEGGLVKLSGNFLLDHEAELVNLIKHVGKLAEEKNALHKVTKIEKANGGLIAETSDHNLALRIGKALLRAYKGEHSYKFLKEEKFVEV